MVLVALFAVQNKGTARVGQTFGPIMAVWFVVLGVLGLVQIVREPQVLLALDPCTRCVMQPRSRAKPLS